MTSTRRKDPVSLGEAGSPGHATVTIGSLIDPQRFARFEAILNRSRPTGGNTQMRRPPMKKKDAGGGSEANGHISEKEQDHIPRKGLTIPAMQLTVHLAGHTMVQHLHANAMKILSMPPNTPATSLFRNGRHTRPSAFPSSPLSAQQAPIKVHFYAIHGLPGMMRFLATSIDFLPWQEYASVPMATFEAFEAPWHRRSRRPTQVRILYYPAA